MKKINLLLISLILLSFTSCKDETNDYVRTYFTDSQLTSIIKECLNITVDTANSHLSVTDGFYLYKEEQYRITLPTSANPLIASLTEHNEKALLDSLIRRINRAAEISGDKIKTNFKNAINSTTFGSPDALLQDSLNSLTTHFKNAQTLSLISMLHATVETNLRNVEALSAWEEALAIHQQYGGQTLSVDLTGSVTQQMIGHIMTEMAIEESLMRTDTNHQTSKLMREVFLSY